MSALAEAHWVSAARAGRDLLAAVFDALPMAIYTTDAKGKVLFCNNAATAVFGCSPEDGSGWSPAELLRWPDGTAMREGHSPMNTALRERRAIRGAEGMIIRAGEQPLRVMIYATPLLDGERLIGSVNMLVEFGEKDRANYFEQRLATIVASSEDAIISKDLNGTIITWNKAAERLFGYSASEAVGRPILMLIPDDRHQEETAILESIRNGRPVARYETMRRRKDGSLVPIALTVSPLRDTTGRIIGASKIARDISEQMRAREQQMLVLNEMSHRVKNVLAVAGGLVGLSARSATDPKAMARAVQERLGAYSRAHELTRFSLSDVGQANGQSTTLHTLLRAIISPYLDTAEEGTNIVLEGEDAVIDAGATASLALVLHEFTTNATKYGALSTASGRITIRCGTSEDGIDIVWTERGGPQITQIPERQGFGSVLASKTVEGQLGGSLRYDWRQEGVVITLRIPRSPQS
nr:PAS domain S-box protein [Rhizomicrobium palustre]